MTYLARLDQLRRAELAERARVFASTYNPDLPTIVILPGGMGSRLQRSPAAYDPVSVPPVETFYELWASLWRIFRGELCQLEMNEYTEEADRHPIIAAGELTSLVKSYDGIFRHFRGKANVVGVGYDWRRAPHLECGYVRIFLQRIVEQVKLRHPGAPDPRRRLTLYAHSQGGLVAKLFVESLIAMGETPLDWFERVVTCCTPFYGTNSHFRRYYVGQFPLNEFTGGADAVAKITASFQGTYILLPAPREVVEPRLGQLGLDKYPVMDYETGAPCDPFAESSYSRYRPEMPARHLQIAKEQFRLLDRKLPGEVAAKMFHIRSDIYGDAAKSDLEIYWKKVDGATYSADLGNPVSDNTSHGGRGDNTVPLWSAALADAPEDHVFDMVGVRHGGAAEHKCALHILARLVNGEPVARGPHVAQSDFEYVPSARVAEIAQRLRGAALEDGITGLEGLSPGEYRAFVDSLTLST